MLKNQKKEGRRCVEIEMMGKERGIAKKTKGKEYQEEMTDKEDL